MAVTTPTNIWTPDSGDDYALTTDLAAMADTVDDAIVKRANYGLGTTTEMNAALAEFANGALWWNTTTNTEWRRVSGAWVNQATGEQTVNLASGGVGSNTVYVEAVGKTVSIRVSTQAGTASNGATVGTLPAAFRPHSNTQYVSLQVNSPTANSAWLAVSTSGAMELFHYNTVPSSFLRGSGTWFRA